MKLIGFWGKGGGGCCCLLLLYIFEMSSNKTVGVPGDNSKVPVPASRRLVQTPSENKGKEEKKSP